ncbi:MAG: glycosyltransferase family 2 protein [bacterium]|nr:glycosyltransferase family 2 protein [bacterium]
MISIIIPTLNSGSVLEKCLESIVLQNYPKNKIEIIIVDGGSTDGTLEIAKKYKAKIYNNPLKTGEAGKAVGVKKASGDLMAFIDSDNILPDKDWLNKMTAPFLDEEILGSEPIEYTYRKTDPWLTRYFAMLGMNDPICLFVGNYDRLSILTGQWTNLKFAVEDKNDYLKIKFDHEPLPTIGANGTIFRRKIFTNIGDYLFDIDEPLKILKSKNCFSFAKVKTGIIHTFVEDDVFKFFRKQLRRISDLAYHKTERQTNWEGFLPQIIYFQIQCLLVFPILFQMLKGFWRKPDFAWIFHPVACYSTLFIYLYGYIKGKISPAQTSRKNWKQ